MDHDLVDEFKVGIENNDIAAVSNLVTQHGSLRKYLDEGICSWNKPPLAACRSQEMVDVLLKHGANIARVGEWWAPRFGLDGVLPAIGDYLIQCGATATPHALAGLGLVQRLRAVLDERPDQVNAKGGDGCRPLHFARTVEISQLLLERGADIDARLDGLEPRSNCIGACGNGFCHCQIVWAKLSVELIPNTAQHRIEWRNFVFMTSFHSWCW